MKNAIVYWQKGPLDEKLNVINRILIPSRFNQREMRVTHNHPACCANPTARSGSEHASIKPPALVSQFEQ